jgi:hypothetical protein
MASCSSTPGQPRAQHHRHLAGRRGPRVEVGQRGLDRIVHVFGDLVVGEIRQAETPAAAARAHLAPALVLGDHGHRQAHQRAHIGRQRAIGARHHHHVVFTGQSGHHLHHARVFGAGQLLDPAQQLDLGGAVQ